MGQASRRKRVQRAREELRVSSGSKALYHFTALEYLQKILEEGLTRGDVPTSRTGVENAVWLTTDPEPSRQGWADDPHILSDEERAAYGRVFGEVPKPGARFPDKRAIRLEVDVPDGDPNLVGWLHFARVRRIKNSLLKSLNRTGGGGEGDWFLYIGDLPPDWILSVAPLSASARTLLTPDGPEE